MESIDREVLQRRERGPVRSFRSNTTTSAHTIDIAGKVIDQQAFVPDNAAVEANSGIALQPNTTAEPILRPETPQPTNVAIKTSIQPEEICGSSSAVPFSGDVPRRGHRLRRSSRQEDVTGMLPLVQISSKLISVEYELKELARPLTNLDRTSLKNQVYDQDALEEVLRSIDQSMSHICETVSSLTCHYASHPGALLSLYLK